MTRFMRGAGICSVATALLITGGAQAAGLTARGNEPSWNVQVTDQAIIFNTIDGPTVSVEPVPAAKTANEVIVYAAAVDGKPFALVVADKICSDSMTGMPFPKTVAVVVGEQAYIGCGGESLSLLLGDWQVEEIGGQAVVAGSDTSIAFDLDGRVHGNSSCNRFFGSFALSGEALTISNTGGTMMACDDGLMEQEQRFLTALATVRRFERTPEGRMRLVDDNGRAVVSVRE
ncbi:META domain-containing protein [Devosia sp. CN2-171]|jgi:heat shock protein HslJ|uniref:META domain-containing protein n=1 Tax=Devosia sp. CN2-171 TaxID=3400909 RepID=UPI003BF7B563